MQDNGKKQIEKLSREKNIGFGNCSADKSYALLNKYFVKAYKWGFYFADKTNENMGYSVKIGTFSTKRLNCQYSLYL
jgi:hypothetical protein